MFSIVFSNVSFVGSCDLQMTDLIKSADNLVISRTPHIIKTRSVCSKMKQTTREILLTMLSFHTLRATNA
jgi:hypothetical protein